MTMNTHIARSLSAFGIASVFVGAAWFGQGMARADQGMIPAGGPAGTDVYAWEVGDDNQDGIIQEDESGWDWRTMGNHCGRDDLSQPIVCFP